MVQFGPADYSMSLGITGQWDHPKVKEAERFVIQTALKMGIAPRAEITVGVSLGTTGPGSIAPDGQYWGSRFPGISIRDQVLTERLTLAALGVDAIASVVGGSKWCRTRMLRHMAGRIPPPTGPAPIHGPPGSLAGQRIFSKDSAGARVVRGVHV